MVCNVKQMLTRYILLSSFNITSLYFINLVKTTTTSVSYIFIEFKMLQNLFWATEYFSVEHTYFVVI